MWQRGAAERRVDALVARCVPATAYLSDAWHCRQTPSPGSSQLGAVRIVAVAAGDAGGEHLALLERAVVVDLVAHLPVGVIEAAARAARRHGCRTAIGREPSPRRSRRGARGRGRRSRPPCAGSAGGALRCGIAGRGIDRPGRRCCARRSGRPGPCGSSSSCRTATSSAWSPRPGDMTRALAVAGLAADADLGPGRGEAVLRRIVVLAHAGRVALGAHEVPVLVELRPVQDVVVADLLVRIEVEPALAALVLRPAVPGDRERLQPAVGKFDQILLQRIEAERVFDLERGELAVRPVGLDEELAVRRKKRECTP